MHTALLVGGGHVVTPETVWVRAARLHPEVGTDVQVQHSLRLQHTKYQSGLFIAMRARRPLREEY